MPDPAPDPETKARLKAEIVQHLLTGATMRAVAALPGMPPWQRIRHWRRANPAFDQEVADAMRRGRARRFGEFDEALAEAVLVRYRAREPLKAIAADPAMPSIDRMAHWRRTQVAFAAEVGRVMAIHADTRRQIRDARPPPWPFDPAMADRLLVAVIQGARLKTLLGAGRRDPALPSYEAVQRWRREHPEFDAEMAWAARNGVHRRHRAERRRRVEEDIAPRIAMGATLASLGRRPDMPCTGALSRWIAEDPELAREVHHACGIREMILNDRLLAAAERLGPIPLKDLKRILARESRHEARLRNWPGRKWRGR